MYVEVEDIKKHLNIDYPEDDQYLKELIEVAEASVKMFIQQDLSSLATDGKLPADLRHAIRLLVGQFYANRETTAFSTPSEIPFGLTYLLLPHRKPIV